MSIPKQYQNMVLQVKKDEDSYTDKAMQPVYKAQQDALLQVHTFIAQLYIKYGKDGKLNITPFQRKQILSTLNEKLKSVFNNLGQSEIDTVKAILSQNYQDTYYKNAYIIGMRGDGDNIAVSS